MKRKYLAIAICLALPVSFFGCQTQRRMSPNQGNNKPQISATSQRSPYDYYVVIGGSGVQGRAGTYNGAPAQSRISGGTRVRVVDMKDGWYITQLPNNNVVSIPMNSAKPDNTTPSQQIPNVTGTAAGLSNQESTMIDLINGERNKAGLRPLSSNGDLTRLARLKSKDISDKNYFSHNSPTYGSPFDMLKKFGISYMYAGENLAKNSTVQAAHQALMNSPDHKRNILNPNYTDVGIGVVPGSGGMDIYTQMFIGK